MRPLLVTFVGGASGPWRVQRTEPVVGESLPMTERMSMLEGEDRGAAGLCLSDQAPRSFLHHERRCALV